MNALLILAYKGTAYCGWQVQPNGVSVQKTVQNAIEEAFSVPVTLTGCSRTDAGVHARGFACVASGIPDSVPTEKLPEAIGRKLPADIAVLQAKEVPEAFHPRYDAKGKHYRYTVRNARVNDPFRAEFCALYPRHIDETLVGELCNRFCGTHDFRSCMASGSSVSDTVRTLRSFTCTRVGEEVYFDLEADGFLYNMVRILVGTVLDLASGGLKDTPEAILASLDRSRAGHTMPACGLCLEEVFY